MRIIYGQLLCKFFDVLNVKKYFINKPNKNNIKGDCKCFEQLSLA